MKQKNQIKIWDIKSGIFYTLISNHKFDISKQKLILSVDFEIRLSNWLTGIEGENYVRIGNKEFLTPHFPILHNAVMGAAESYWELLKVSNNAKNNTVLLKWGKRNTLEIVFWQIKFSPNNAMPTQKQNPNENKKQ